jgi:hypothetical protein
VPPGGSAEGALFIIVDSKSVTEYKSKIKINLNSEEQTLTTIKTNFLGPIQ